MLCNILIGPSDTVMFPNFSFLKKKKTTFAFIFFINGVLGRNQINQHSFFGLIIKPISQQEQCKRQYN